MSELSVCDPEDYRRDYVQMLTAIVLEDYTANAYGNRVDSPQRSRTNAYGNRIDSPQRLRTNAYGNRARAACGRGPRANRCGYRTNSCKRNILGTFLKNFPRMGFQEQ